MLRDAVFAHSHDILQDRCFLALALATTATVALDGLSAVAAVTTIRHSGARDAFISDAAATDAGGTRDAGAGTGL